MSRHNYTRIIVKGVWESIASLAKSIEGVFPDRYFALRASGADITVDFDDDLTEDEEKSLDDAIESHQALERGAS